MRKIKQKFLSAIASFIIVLGCLLVPTLQAAAGGNGGYSWLQHYNRTYQIKNWATGYNLNMWVDDAAYLYNGTPVTMYSYYTGDNTHWFKVEHETPIYRSWRQWTSYNCTITAATNTRFALNIGYRTAGSTAVMYDRNLDLEQWIIESTGSGGEHNRIILKSNQSLCLAQNPYTQQVYLENIGASNYQDWKFIQVN